MGILQGSRGFETECLKTAVQAGMAEMSEQFKSVGAEVYLDEATVEVNA